MLLLGYKNMILEYEDFKCCEIPWCKHEHIQRLAEWFENKCLEEVTEFFNEFLDKIEDFM